MLLVPPCSQLLVPNLQLCVNARLTVDALQQLLLVELVLLNAEFQILAKQSQVLHLLLIAVLVLEQLLVLLLCQGSQLVQLPVDVQVLVGLLDHVV